MDIQASHALMKICLKAALIWIISMLLAIPEAVFSDLHPFHEESTNQTFISCAPYPHSNELHPKIHSMASFLVFYIIPLAIISVYYYFIAKNLIQSAYNLPVEGNIHVKKQVGTKGVSFPPWGFDPLHFLWTPLTSAVMRWSCGLILQLEEVGRLWSGGKWKLLTTEDQEFRCS